jgi:hypothetical protein
VSSPVAICNENVSSHGITSVPTLNSPTYDLGTWNFDAEGDYEAESWFITGTNNGGLNNNQQLLRGSFVGASLPALPLVGFGSLAVALGLLGGRALRARR